METASAYTNTFVTNESVTIEMEPVLLFLIFYIDENHIGKKMIAEAAQTRLKNIKNSKWYDESKHKVHCPPIQSLEEIKEIVSRYIKIYGGKNKAFTKEIGVVSHAGRDGPICYNTEIVNDYLIDNNGPYKHQMSLVGWGKIEFNWYKESPICVFYGCNTANPLKIQGEIKIFARNISALGNFIDVEVWGQSTSSFPSLYPDYRVISLARAFDEDEFSIRGRRPTVNLPDWLWNAREYTYMVGGNPKEIWGSVSVRPDKGSLGDRVLQNFPVANPMRCYMNGNEDPIRIIHQGYFNDHRKN